MLYASYNRGFKGGAYNGSPIFDPTTVRAVDPEYVNAYEVGAKTQFLEDRVQLNVAAFYNDYTDMQVFRFVPDPNTGIPTASSKTRHRPRSRASKRSSGAGSAARPEPRRGVSRCDVQGLRRAGRRQHVR